MVYPVNLSQNILTTGLIAYRIWCQHRESRACGLSQLSNPLNLTSLIRIIIESALIYTLHILILFILDLISHPAQVILHATLIPSIGQYRTLTVFRLVRTAD
jgi:hypothetical protein